MMHERRVARIEPPINDGDGRTFTARAVAYGVVDDYQTRFVEGVFAESLQRRLPVVAWSHDWSEPIGRVTEWEDRTDGLYVTGRLSDPDAVPRARQAAVQLADGTLDEVSVGFFRLEERTADDGVVEIVRGDLDEVSIVLRGAVPGAKVLSVRSVAGPVDMDALVELARRKAAGELTDAESKAALDLLAGASVGELAGETGEAGETAGTGDGGAEVDAMIDQALTGVLDRSPLR